ncbi:MAG TPA: hypothetical protein PKA29_01255 [Candidatus Saccharibacteria bacterium]|jgi:hypothetical protein|nr:hypothetical protein [Candidatus Saccharibacteria bacterium]
MEPETDKPKKCDDKLKFKNRVEAEGAKVYAEHRHGVKLKVYFCKDCEWWHLSSA